MLFLDDVSWSEDEIFFCLVSVNKYSVSIVESVNNRVVTCEQVFTLCS